MGGLAAASVRAMFNPLGQETGSPDSALQRFVFCCETYGLSHPYSRGDYWEAEDITSPEDRYLKAASVALGKIGREKPNAVIKVVREKLGAHAWFLTD